jgi:hypothetical protein
MNLALHFLHIYHLDLHLKKKILPSNVEKILLNNKFLKVPFLEIDSMKIKMAFASYETVRPWALNLDYTTFPFLHLVYNCRPIHLISIEIQNTDSNPGSPPKELFLLLQLL